MSRKEVDHLADMLNNLAQAQKNLEKMFVEVLKAINSIIENRIEGLEQIGDEIDKKSKKKVVRKEKVEVE